MLNFNQFASIINNDTTMQVLGLSLPILTSDDLIWQYFNDFQLIPEDSYGYIQDLVLTLACENITSDKNHLTLHKKGIELYTAEFSFNKFGKVEEVIIRNSEGDLIFKIISFYPKFPFLIITGISIGSFVILFIVVKWRRNKTREL